MAIVRKKVVAQQPETVKSEEKKVVAQPVATKKPVVEKKQAVPVATKKQQPTGNKKVSLINKPKNPKSFEIKEGAQATQEAFIDIFCKKLIERGIEVNKVITKEIQRAYGETLEEVTNIASYKDTAANIFYARRYIGDRVTAPPKAANGLKTLMRGHYEIKVRKLLGDENQIKYFGEVSEDGTTFIAHVFDEEGNDTGETVEISLDEEAVAKTSGEKKAATKVTKKEAPVVTEEVEEIEEVEEEDYFDDDDFLDEDEE